MSEVINQNVIDSSKKFVDFAGLDYFWEKAKSYVDGVDASLSERVGTNESDIAGIKDELNSLSGGESSISAQIENAIAQLDVEDTVVEGQYVSGVSEVDGKITVTRADLPVYETVGSAAAVQGNLDTHIADTVAHVTADERTAWNAAKSAIDTFLADADMTESAVDTLKELQSYMTSDGEAAAELVNRVAALEGIDHDAYKAADETVLASAKEYADGKDAAIEAAKNAAIADADAKLALKANAADVYTKTEVDDLLAANSTADQAYAKTYTDALYESIQFVSNDDIDSLFV